MHSTRILLLYPSRSCSTHRSLLEVGSLSRPSLESSLSLATLIVKDFYLVDYIYLKSLLYLCLYLVLVLLRSVYIVYVSTMLRLHLV